MKNYSGREIKVLRIDSGNVDEELDSITSFYNDNFPHSPHEKKYKKYMYGWVKLRPIILVAKDGHRTVGLLESWFLRKRAGCRLFSTLLVDEPYRGRGLADRMLTILFESSKDDGDEYVWVVNYRLSNRSALEPFYEKYGFFDPKHVGKYANGEDMWEMQKPHTPSR
jgi:ribosomal protein S18 acetylase RimI-like enzyme